LIVVDSNVWIFAEDASANEYPIATEKVKRVIESGEFGLNIIIASEVYHRLSRVHGPARARERLARIMESPAARWLIFPTRMVGQAIALAEEAGLRINHALIAQQALEAKASVLTDNVRDFRKVGGLKVVPLR
jgi:predicted nucleic acid-binding protein